MKFGFFTMPEHPPIENWTLSYDRDIAAVVEAERLGFHEFWIGEHHTGGFENVPVPEFMIAKASALTHTIRLGTGVVNLPYQDPFMVAERLAFLDHLTHGRLDYGFGGGGLPTDKALFGLEPSEAAPRTNEALEIIWQLLTSEDPVSYEGVYWKYEDRQLQVGPYQDVPPFAIAGLTGTHNYAKCGERGWKPLSVHFAPIDNGTYALAPDLKAMGAAMLEAGQRSGIPEATTRDNWRIVREVYVTDDRNQAMNDIREGVKRSTRRAPRRPPLAARSQPPSPASSPATCTPPPDSAPPARRRIRRARRGPPAMRLLDLLRRPGSESHQPTPPADREEHDQPTAAMAFAQRPEIAATLERLADAERAEDDRLRGERERLRGEEAEREARHAAQAAADQLRWRVAAQRREHGDDAALQARWAGRNDQHAAAERAELDRQVREDREDAEATRRFHEEEQPVLEALGREEAELEARAAVPYDLQFHEHEHGHGHEQDEAEEDPPL